jgi:hypothetical protein
MRPGAKAPGPALLARHEGVGDHSDSVGGQPRGLDQGLGAAGLAADQDDRLDRLAQRQDCFLDRGGRRRRPHGLLGDDRLGAGFQPGAVCGQDQADRAAGRPIARLDGLGGDRRDLVGAVGGARPDGVGPDQGGDVGVQRRVILAVIGGVVADDVDDRSEGAPRVMQVRHAVAVAGPQVQQGAGGLVGHAAVAVGGARRHALEEAEHRPHLRRPVQGRHELHLAGAGIGETGGDLIGHEGREQGVGAVHARPFMSEHHHV